MPELGSDATGGMNAWIVLPQTSGSNSRRATGDADGTWTDTWSDAMHRSQADNHGSASGRRSGRAPSWRVAAVTHSPRFRPAFRHSAGR
jgi:hypothetical protein